MTLAADVRAGGAINAVNRLMDGVKEWKANCRPPADNPKLGPGPEDEI